MRYEFSVWVIYPKFMQKNGLFVLPCISPRRVLSTTKYAYAQKLGIGINKVIEA